MTYSPPDVKEWAATLRSRRVAARLDRIDLARAADRSYQTVRDIELGRRMPSVDTMLLIDRVIAEATGAAPHLERLQNEVDDLRAAIDRILARLSEAEAVA